MSKKTVHCAAVVRNGHVRITTFKDRDRWIKTILAVDAGDLSYRAKIVATRLAFHLILKTQWCEPAKEKLALGTGLSESTVHRAIIELEDGGWISVERTCGRDSNSYTLLTPTLSQAKGLNPVTDDMVEDLPTMSTVTPQPCQRRHRNPVTADTLISISEERSEERSGDEGAPSAPARRRKATCLLIEPVIYEQDFNCSNRDDVPGGVAEAPPMSHLERGIARARRLQQQGGVR